MGAVGAAAPTIISQLVQTMYSEDYVVVFMKKLLQYYGQYHSKVTTKTQKASSAGFIIVSYYLSIRCPKKMHHICFVHSFHTFLRNLLKHTSKDSQIHGGILTPPPDSVTRPWRSRCHVLEVPTVLGHAKRCSASGLPVTRVQVAGESAGWQHE